MKIPIHIRRLYKIYHWERFNKEIINDIRYWADLYDVDLAPYGLLDGMRILKKYICE